MQFDIYYLCGNTVQYSYITYEYNEKVYDLFMIVAIARVQEVGTSVIIDKTSKKNS